jgi:hypothetical protein
MEKFQPKILKVNGGYVCYSFVRKVLYFGTIDEAFIFTNQDNFQTINNNLGTYKINDFDGDWENPEWIDVSISILKLIFNEVLK